MLRWWGDRRCATPHTGARLRSPGHVLVFWKLFERSMAVETPESALLVAALSNWSTTTAHPLVHTVRRRVRRPCVVRARRPVSHGSGEPVLGGVGHPDGVVLLSKTSNVATGPNSSRWTSGDFTCVDGEERGRSRRRCRGRVVGPPAADKDFGVVGVIGEQRLERSREEMSIIGPMCECRRTRPNVHVHEGVDERFADPVRDRALDEDPAAVMQNCPVNVVIRRQSCLPLSRGRRRRTRSSVSCRRVRVTSA